MAFDWKNELSIAPNVSSHVDSVAAIQKDYGVARHGQNQMEDDQDPIIGNTYTSNPNSNPQKEVLMPEYFTSGQVARRLRISVSTLKRWIALGEAIPKETRNASGWMLFSEVDLENLRRFKKDRRRNGRSFSKQTLKPMM